MKLTNFTFGYALIFKLFLSNKILPTKIMCMVYSLCVTYALYKSTFQYGVAMQTTD